MQLSSHDLQQFNKDYFYSLSVDLLIELCLQLSTDLKEAHDRLNQNSQNSSKPPSSGSEFPWNNSNSVNSDEDDILSGNSLSTHDNENDDDEVEDEIEAEDISESETEQENPEITATSSDKNIDTRSSSFLVKKMSVKSNNRTLDFNSSQSLIVLLLGNLT